MELANKSDAEILSVANPIMDNLMDASTKIDYDRHVQDFTDRLRSQISKEQLEKICRSYQSSKGTASDVSIKINLKQRHFCNKSYPNLCFGCNNQPC
jgi:2C-methyl-D-erythritol 2,4-cyclodiphosphate synthase